MWGNYALALYRTLSRHRLYAALNTLGLALGIAVCSILLLVVRFESGFDRFIPEADHVFRVNQLQVHTGRPVSDDPSTQAVVLPPMLTSFPQIKAGARLMGATLVARTGDRSGFEDVVFADPAIWDVFPLPFAAGDRATAIGDTTSLVISQAMARKYFGTDRAIGRRLTMVIDGAPRDYRVTGVLRDLPPDTHLDLNFIMRLDDSVLPQRREMLHRWGSSFLYTYVRLSSPADEATIEAGFPAFTDRYATDVEMPASEHMKFHLVPLRDIHFADAKVEAFKRGADPLFVGALGIMGVVTLLIALVNYVSLATARAGLRAREVAVRKVMGATRKALMIQFIAESVAVALVAGLIAAAFMELTLPGVSAVLGEPIRMTYFGPDGIALPLAGLCLLVGLAAGVYPALALSSFPPASVLASARTPGGGRAGARVREALAIFQFAIAITLMACTAVVFSQIQYLQNADVGFRRDGMVVVEGLGDPQVAPQMRALVDAFRAQPGALSVTASDRRPAGDTENSGNMHLADRPDRDFTIIRERIGADYLETYGLRLIAGRGLDTAHGLDDRAGLDSEIIADRGLNILVNEMAARTLGETNPRNILGKRLNMGTTSSGKPFVATIVGVVGDVRFGTARLPAQPQTYMMDTHLGKPGQPTSWAAAIRVQEGGEKAMLARLESVWRSMVPGVPFRGETARVAMKPFYDADARRGQLFAAGAILSVMIACLGLYGLAAFNTSRRFKEIGIRKTLGASTSDVLRLLIGEFLRPVLWANLIAWPLAWFAMRSWLAGFDQRIDLNPLFFLAPTAVAIVVAIGTVLEQALRVARAEPSRALRYE